MVLLLHGATVPGWEFDRLTPFLGAAGYRTICPDLFGHGLSAHPNAPHNRDLYTKQVGELLDALQISEPLCITGHSLGAAIGARFASSQPDRISALALIAPLLDFAATQPAIRVLRIPLVGALLVRTWLIPMLIRRRTRRYTDIEDGRFVGWFRRQVEVPGYARSLVSLLTSGSLGDQRETYGELDDTNLPVVILRGTADAIFPADHLEEMRQILPNAEIAEFSGLEHPLMLTHPEIVAPTLTEFFRTQSTPNSQADLLN